MALFANLVLKDGQATPVNHTFAPAYRRDNEMGWTDRSAGVLAGFRNVSLVSRPATNGNAGSRISVKVKDPRLAVLGTNDAGFTPNAVKAYEALGEFSFLLPAGSDRQARLDIIAYVRELLSQPQIIDSIVDLATPV